MEENEKLFEIDIEKAIKVYNGEIPKCNGICKLENTGINIITKEN